MSNSLPPPKPRGSKLPVTVSKSLPEPDLRKYAPKKPTASLMPSTEKRLTTLQVLIAIAVITVLVGGVLAWNFWSAFHKKHTELAESVKILTPPLNLWIQVLAEKEDIQFKVENYRWEIYNPKADVRELAFDLVLDSALYEITGESLKPASDKTVVKIKQASGVRATINASIQSDKNELFLEGLSDVNDDEEITRWLIRNGLKPVLDIFSGRGIKKIAISCVIDPSPELDGLRVKLSDLKAEQERQQAERVAKLESLKARWSPYINQPIRLAAILGTDQYLFSFQINDIENDGSFNATIRWDSGGATGAEGTLETDGSIQFTENRILLPGDQVLGTAYKLIKSDSSHISGEFIHKEKKWTGIVTSEMVNQ